MSYDIFGGERSSRKLDKPLSNKVRDEVAVVENLIKKEACSFPLSSQF